MPAAKQKVRWSHYPARAGETPTIDHWIPCLQTHFTVDRKGISDLSRLATQYGMEGYKQANMIIGKLIKKQNDDKTMFFPSHFVTSSVNHAEYDIQSKGTAYIDIITV